MNKREFLQKVSAGSCLEEVYKILKKKEFVDIAEPMDEDFTSAGKMNVEEIAFLSYYTKVTKEGAEISKQLEELELSSEKAMESPLYEKLEAMDVERNLALAWMWKIIEKRLGLPASGMTYKITKGFEIATGPKKPCDCPACRAERGELPIDLEGMDMVVISEVPIPPEIKRLFS